MRIIWVKGGELYCQRCRKAQAFTVFEVERHAKNILADRLEYCSCGQPFLVGITRAGHAALGRLKARRLISRPKKNRSAR